MFGIILASVGSFFHEAADSIGKTEVAKRKESPYTLAVLLLIWGLVFFVILVLTKRVEFVFVAAALPTFLTRAVFEILQLHMGLKALIKSDRSTMGLIRVGTIPLLLIVDITIGYSITQLQLLGMAIILVSIIIMFAGHVISKKGIWFVIGTTVNAVITLSLYKYNISHFNSVAGEQIMILVILVVYFFLIAHFVAKENPIKFLRKPIFFTESIASGLGTVLESFAMSFAPASVIIAAKRSSRVLFSIVSGKLYFHETHILKKLVLFLAVASGIILLAF